MKEIHWTLSINRKEDQNKIKLLCEKGRILKMTTILGRPVCWEYELLGAREKVTGDPVRITAFICTGR